MSRSLAAVAVLIGPVFRVEVAPGFAGSLEEVDAFADALLACRLRDDEPAATEGAA